VFPPSRARKKVRHPFVTHALVTLSKKPRYSFSTVINSTSRAFEFRRALAIANYKAFRRPLQHDLVELVVVLDVLQRFPFLMEYSGGCRDEHIAALINSCMCRKEKSQQQRADVRTVHVRAVIRMIFPYRTLVGSKSSLEILSQRVVRR